MTESMADDQSSLDPEAARAEIELAKRSGALYRALNLDELDHDARRIFGKALARLPLPEKISTVKVNQLLAGLTADTLEQANLLEVFASMPDEWRVRPNIVVRISLKNEPRETERRNQILSRLALIFLAATSAAA